ncbi:hypothetical protein FRC11_008028 [Ceratobasidium sp. 423]|nr:hypothetical protein FRC11_008028 [Ceratobasidium sp. 423]
MSRSKSEEGEQKGRKYCPWCIGRLRKGDHDICQLCFLFQLVLSSNPLPSGLHGSPLPDITYVSGNCPRIIYVRDIGVATEWASDLVEALQAASSKIQSSTLGECPIASTPIAVILGYSPPLKSPTKKSPTKKSPSRRFNFDDDDSISSDSGPPGQDCGEGEAAKSLRESRVLERIKQWQDESLMQQLLPPLRLDVSLFGSNLNSSTTNSSSRHGHLRWCVVMPDNRNEDEERISRERRRKELNTLRVQLSLAAAGASFELDLTSFPGASEGLKRRWISDLIEAKVLSQVVDRTLTPPSVRIAGSEARLQVSWSSFSQAWDSYHEFETNQASWIRAEINENSFDEVFLRVKMMDLSSHERGLLQCVVNPDQIKTTFDSVHLPMETVDRIRSLVSLPLLHPEVFQCGILKQHSMTGALLFGPPGTGKTHIARAVAKESGARMIAIKPSDIQQMYVGESEKVVTAVFQLARRLMPCLIFIDEIDALFGARTNQGDSNSARYHASLITQFMQEMDGLLLSKVVVIGATNRPFDLDDAILRRLPCRVLVDLPNVKAREQILRTMLKDEHLASDVSYQDLALKTENYTGSDLKHLCVSAVLAAVKDQVNLPWMSAEGTSTSSRGAFAPSARNTRPTSTSAPSPAQGRSTSAVDVDERSDKGDIKNPPSIPIIVTPDQGLSIPNGTLLLSETHSSEVTTTHQAADKGFGGTGSISTPDQRILCYRHFAHALAEVKPSTSEAGMSVRMLRKWNAKLGTGESSK